MERDDAWHMTDDLMVEDGKGDPFAAAIRATRMPMIVTDPRRDDNPIVFVNDAFLRLTDALAKLRNALIELLRARYRLIHAIVIGVAIDCQLIGQIARAVLELLELASYRIIQAEIIHLRAEITQLRANILRFFGFIAF